MSERRGELLGLIEQVITDSLGSQQEERLEYLLQDPENQAVYCSYMEMHANLHWQARFLSIPSGEIAHPATIALNETNRGDDALAEASDIRPLSVRFSRRNPKNRKYWLSVAAGLGGLVLLASGWLIGAGVLPGKQLLSWLPSTGNAASGVTASGVSTSGTQELARITGTMNSRWAKQEGPADFGFDSPLVAGQRIKLTQGLAEVTFSSGVKVVLEAPAELDVAAYNESFLRGGRMSAMVPDGAEGFRVHLDGLTVVDRGTEFGLKADSDGTFELHVFKGLVEGHFGEDWGQMQRLVEWHQDTAVSIHPIEKRIQPLADSETKFVRSLSSHSPGNGLLAKEDFEYPAAPLAHQNGGFGWGGPWTILSTQGDASVADTIVEGSLRYEGLFNAGNRVSISGSFDRARRILSTSIGGVFDTAGYIEDQDGARLIGRDGTTLYMSFVQRVNAVGEEFYGLELNRGDGNRNRVLCFGHGAHLAWLEGPPRAPNRELGATGWAVTSEFNGPDKNTLLEIGRLGEESTQTILVVVKIEFGEGNVDKVTTYVNPQYLHDESLCEPRVVGVGNFAFDQLSLANFGGFKTLEVDHIRIGKCFEAVTSQSFELLQVASNMTK